jgi:hypothetical protein
MTSSSRFRSVLVLEMWLAVPLCGCGRTDPLPDDQDDIAELADGVDADESMDGVDALDSTPTPVCGDGVRDWGEECEIADSDLGASCESMGWAGGDVSCGADCKFDVSECFTCGDSVLSDAEQCDGSNVGDLGCADVGYEAGTLGCDDACGFDVSRCNTCGNGVVEGYEQCEPNVTGAESCANLGWGGTMAVCGADCNWDLSACSADEV